MSDNKWLRREIKDGLNALVALGLEGQPAAEVMPRTADIWLFSVERSGCTIEKIDAPRVREGFGKLFPKLLRWPTPAQLISEIPPRPVRDALREPPPTEEECEAGKRALKALQKSLEGKFNVPGTKVDEEQRRRELDEQAIKLKEENHE